MRFPEKERHQIFLEPEGLDDDLVYPNGISTALPRDVQEAYVRSIRGLEAAEIVRPGYAIEYDHLDPRALSARLELKDVPRLFFAGQVNGTTGYEEAAAQGLVAGVNAARAALGEPPLVLSRTESVIGVMIDDLVSRGVTEPYRMFTSRAEMRLSLRTDNADQRLTPTGIALGIVTDRRKRLFDAKVLRLAEAREALNRTQVSSAEAMRHGLAVGEGGAHRTAYDALGSGRVEAEALARTVAEVSQLSEVEWRYLHAEALYAPHLGRQTREAARLSEAATVKLPLTLDYASMAGLTTELRDKLSQTRPETLAQASQIEGMTPAAMLLVAGHARRIATEQA